MNFTKRCTLILIVLVACVGCDQTTKSLAQSFLPESESWSFLGDTVRLRLAHNPGAFLGFGASLPEAWRAALLSLGVGVILLALLGYSLFSKSVSRIDLLAYALLLAGGVGNLIDRVIYGGTVVDFINLGVGPVRTGIFNIADMAVVGGAFLFIAGMCFGRGKDLARSGRE